MFRGISRGQINCLYRRVIIDQMILGLFNLRCAARDCGTENNINVDNKNLCSIKKKGFESSKTNCVSVVAAINEALSHRSLDWQLLRKTRN